MHLLYPSDPLNDRRVDEAYAEEFEAVRAQGTATHLFSFESFEAGSFRAVPALSSGEIVLYRGWMLRVPEYGRLVQAIEMAGATALVSAAHYRLCHHLPEWYPLVSSLTAETVVLDEGSDYGAALSPLQWDGYFIKDFVKSLSTGTGSLVSSPDQVEQVFEQLRKYRGAIEGGVCVRRAQQFAPGSERRYFVVHGVAHAADKRIPAVVQECAARIDSPFFSVDTATLSGGQIVVVELGDGQVSDRKEWPPEVFAHMMARA
jgi:hypothetical protein